MSDNLSCIVSEEELNQPWDDFIAGIPGAFHEQAAPWAVFRLKSGWASKRIILKQDERIVAGAQVLVQSIRLLGKIGYISYGPCITVDMDVSRELISAIKQFAKKEHIVYLVLVPPYYGEPLIPLLSEAGFEEAVEGLPPKIYLTSTVLIDLSQTSGEILGGMKTKTRYNINLGIRRGIMVRQGNVHDLDIFFNLMLATCARRNTHPVPSDRKYFESLWNEFSPRGWVRLHLAEYCGEVVCAAFSFSFGDTFRLWKFGWSGEHGNISPSNVLYWRIIEEAKSDGFRFIDFVSLDTEIARNFESGAVITPELKTKPFYGPTIFKLGFGGKIVHLPEAFCYFPNPLFRLLYLFPGRMLLQSKSFNNMMNSIWAWVNRKRGEDAN